MYLVALSRPRELTQTVFQLEKQKFEGSSGPLQKPGGSEKEGTGRDKECSGNVLGGHWRRRLPALPKSLKTVLVAVTVSSTRGSELAFSRMTHPQTWASWHSFSKANTRS